MEVTDIQNDSDLKRAASEQDLLSFDSGYVSSDSYNPICPAKNFTALFGSAYCCEQLLFENEKQKTKSGSLLTDENLIASLHISASTVGADIFV